MTSKLQLTIPKAIAEAHGIVPGMELDFESAEDVIRLRVASSSEANWADTIEARLRAFDEASDRQTERDRRFRSEYAELMSPSSRGWTRDSLYDRGLPR